jgi:hypothetical protein
MTTTEDYPIYDDHSPFSISETLVPNAEAKFLRIRSPGSRVRAPTDLSRSLTCFLAQPKMAI